MATENSGDLMRYTVELIQDGDDLVLPLPPDTMERLGWQIGDTLEWKDLGNQTWSITRKNQPSVNEDV